MCDSSIVHNQLLIDLLDSSEVMMLALTKELNLHGVIQPGDVWGNTRLANTYVFKYNSFYSSD